MTNTHSESEHAVENFNDRSLQDRLTSILGVNRWIDGRFPTLEPASAEEISLLLQKYPGMVMVVGSGSSFGEDFSPGEDTVVVLMRKFRNPIVISSSDQTITLQAGWTVQEANRALAEMNFVVPALHRFKSGTIGGRLAGVSSRPYPGEAHGWIQNLLQLEVVLPTGEFIKFGSRCMKDVAGYDLRHLFTGSRGGVGIIIGATFRCYPLDSYPQTEKIYVSPVAGSYDLSWKRLLDPAGRMQPGA